MTTRILFVCLGNICRSPAAEGVFATLAQDLNVELDSAGTSGWHVGEPPFEPMQKAAKSKGYDLSNLRSRVFDKRDFDRFDLIIGMDEKNIARMAALRPPGNATPLKLFTDFAKADREASHIPDPYYTQDFDGALRLIEDCAQGLLEAIGTANI